MLLPNWDKDHSLSRETCKRRDGAVQSDAAHQEVRARDFQTASHHVGEIPVYMPCEMPSACHRKGAS